MKISIIIPFYNVENYIENCINSVKSQTFTDFECFLIDDKSTDRSLLKATNAIAGDSRFRIIQHKTNLKQGAARNTGLDNASGEWIVFLDSDDQWENNFLEKMYTEATTSQVDIVVCQYQKVNDSGNVIEVLPLPFSGVITCKNLLVEAFLETPSPVNKIYRRTLWEHLRFPTDIFYEDLATIFQTVFYAQNVKFIHEAPYLYYQRVGSTTKKFNEKQIDDRLKAFKIIEEACQKNHFENTQILINIYASRIVRSGCFNILKYDTTTADKSKIALLTAFKKQLNPNLFNIKHLATYSSNSLKLFSALFNTSIILTYWVGLLWIKLNKEKI